MQLISVRLAQSLEQVPVKTSEQGFKIYTGEKGVGTRETSIFATLAHWSSLVLVRGFALNVPISIASIDVFPPY